MNKTVSEMVNLLFRDVVQNEETKAMHDELMLNCQEHFQDLVDSGMTEETAAAAVRESLNGMQEVIDQYPKREKDEAEAIPAEQDDIPAPAEEADDTVRFWPAGGIRRIRVDAGSHDVKVSPVNGDRIEIRCNTPEEIRVEQQGDTLTVETVRVTDEIRNAGEETAEQGKRVMDMTLNELLGKVRDIVDKTTHMVMDRMNNGSFFSDELIEIRVPEKLISALEINASSGDVAAAPRGIPEITLRTASGDVELDCSVKDEIDRLFASSASGDIRISSAFARRCEASAISGDVDVEGDFGELFCKSVSGDVDFDGTAVELQGKSVSGDVDLRLQQAPSGTVSAESTSGDVSIELPDDCAPAAVSISTTIGEIDCDVEDAGEIAPLKLRARTVSGDIRIQQG